MANAFAGVDFYDVDGLLSEEERAVRDTVRAWVDEHLMPVIGDAYVEGKFPSEQATKQKELVIAQSQLKAAQNSLEYFQRMFRKGYASSG